MKDICLRVHQIRDDWKISQVDFAKRVGVTNAHISAIEKGKTVPSPSLIKLISKEFKINERWLSEGYGSEYAEVFDRECEDVLIDAIDKLNKIRTREVLPIRSRVIPIEGLFSDILDMRGYSEEIQTQYLDICYKLFYHLNNYLDFQKKTFGQSKLHIFPFPDDLIENIKRDINEFETFFEVNSGSANNNTKK